MQWEDFRKIRINDEEQVIGFDIKQFQESINKLRGQNTVKNEEIRILDELEQYAQSLI